MAKQPNEFDALHSLATRRDLRGGNSEVLHDLRAAPKATLTDVMAPSKFGLIHAGLGGAGHASATFTKAPSSAPEDAKALNGLGYSLSCLGRPTEALASYDRALALEPGYAPALNNRGNALKDLGRPGEALASYDKALAIKPDYAEALINRGNALRELARPAEALASYNKALACNPPLTFALNDRGCALMELQRPAEALASFDQPLELEPDLASALCNRGGALICLKRFDEALASCDKALALKPDYVEAHNNRGNALLDLKRPTEALASCDKALALKPNYAQVLNNRGNALLDLKRPAEALASYDKALALKPDFVQALNNRGNAFRDLKRPEEALTLYDEALAVKPDYAVAYDNKAIVLIELGRLKEAACAFERAIKLAPRRVRSYYNLVDVKRMTPGDLYVQAMEELARDIASLTTDEQIDLHFALGKAYADIGDHERSFRNLLDDNALKRRNIVYDESAALGVLENARTTFTHELMQRHEGAGESSFAPVFILGMPRSGTTLVEQILASHSKVFGAGEIDDFERAILEVVGGGARGWLHYFNAAPLMSGEQLRQLGASYMARIKALAPEAERITNKMPENFRFIGLIHLALPNARIIHTRRDPVDTCLSCFSKLFKGNLPYVYDLEELGRYYRAYATLMDYWRGALPQNVMLEVQYEDVVDDLEGQARRIIDHCGLEWDARCLDFHRTERPVRTASATQVRQPIYKSSVGRWRTYEPFLQPLLNQLPPHGPAEAGRRRPRSYGE